MVIYAVYAVNDPSPYYFGENTAHWGKRQRNQKAMILLSRTVITTELLGSSRALLWMPFRTRPITI